MELKEKVVCAYEVSNMSHYELYDVLCRELTFNTMIGLYKLIKHKMETLEDEPRMEAVCMMRGD